LVAKKKRGQATTSRRVLLDTFTEKDLEYWSDRSEDAHAYSDLVYFDLERQRAANHEALWSAARAGSVDYPVESGVSDQRSRYPATRLGYRRCQHSAALTQRFMIGRTLTLKIEVHKVAVALCVFRSSDQFEVLLSERIEKTRRLVWLPRFFFATQVPLLSGLRC